MYDGMITLGKSLDIEGGGVNFHEWMAQLAKNNGIESFSK